MAQKHEPPLTFVLVHGAWHGGWCWSRVADILRARGHRVTTPTQTGLGERGHLLTSEVTMGTFVDDVANENGRPFFLFDTTVEGNGNHGHEGEPYGTELADEHKWALIEYLKTL